MTDAGCRMKTHPLCPPQPHPPAPSPEGEGEERCGVMS
jgi:hypothetical protein